MRFRIAFAWLAVLSLGGCTAFTTELRSLPSFAPDGVVARPCGQRPNQSGEPPSDGRLCLSGRDFEAEVEAGNGEELVVALGPLLPLVPCFPKRSGGTRPLVITLALATDAPYTFDPWAASLTTAAGETIAVSVVESRGPLAPALALPGGPGPVKLVPRDRGARRKARRASNVFSLTFARHVAPEQEFVFDVHLVASDGADVHLPIRFKPGKVSTLAAIP